MWRSLLLMMERSFSNHPDSGNSGVSDMLSKTGEGSPALNQRDSAPSRPHHGSRDGMLYREAVRVC